MQEKMDAFTLDKQMDPFVSETTLLSDLRNRINTLFWVNSNLFHILSPFSPHKLINLCVSVHVVYCMHTGL